MKRANATTKEPGNFVSEWFGFRVYPRVSHSRETTLFQSSARCPFLSHVTQSKYPCVKPASSSGVCTISSCSNGQRQDWLVCPYRALEPSLLADVSSRLFRPVEKSAPGAAKPPLVVPAPALGHEGLRQEIVDSIAGGRLCIVFLQDKLGGEISLSPTPRSPEVAFDITLVEMTSGGATPKLGRFGILEVQTMDFHGSYREVVNNLKDALRLHGKNFHRALQDNQGWLSQKIEGPNIANVFKRTFYQMMVKFQIGQHSASAGCALAIPASVWDSWQRHLGQPSLEPTVETGVFRLTAAGVEPRSPENPAWIYVFDIDSASANKPNPVILKKIVATSAEAVSHYALKVAPDAAMEEGSAVEFLSAKIMKRLSAWWPELAG